MFSFGQINRGCGQPGETQLKVPSLDSAGEDSVHICIGCREARLVVCDGFVVESDDSIDPIDHIRPFRMVEPELLRVPQQMHPAPPV